MGWWDIPISDRLKEELPKVKEMPLILILIGIVAFGGGFELSEILNKNNIETYKNRLALKDEKNAELQNEVKKLQEREKIQDDLTLFQNGVPVAFTSPPTIDNKQDLIMFSHVISYSPEELDLTQTFEFQDWIIYKCDEVSSSSLNFNGEIRSVYGDVACEIKGKNKL